jgi:SAM-dependent methyltransferase
MLPVIPIAIGILAAVGVVMYFVFASFAYGAGYQPTPRRVVDTMLDFASVGPNDLLYDLGAGTGAIIFRAVEERGARAVGVEVEPIRVLYLRWRARKLGDRVQIRRGNLFAQDLRAATVVAVFLWPDAMARLRPILEQQLPEGARVVSYYHPVPGWTPERSDEDLKVLMYRKPPTAASAG